MKRLKLSLSACLLLLGTANAAEDRGVPWGSDKHKLEFCYLRETDPELEESWESISAEEQKDYLERSKEPAAGRFEEVSADYRAAMKKWDINTLKDVLEKDTAKVRDTFANWLGEERGKAYAMKVNTLRSVLARAETSELTEADITALEQYLLPEAVSTIKSIKLSFDAGKKTNPGNPEKPASADKLTSYSAGKPLSGGKLSGMYDNSSGGSGDVPLADKTGMGGMSGTVVPMAEGRGSKSSTIESTSPPDISGGHADKGPGRALSQDEKALAKEIFGNKIDTSKVRIISGDDMTLWGKILTHGGAAVTWGNKIYFPNDNDGKSTYDFQKQPEWLAHEMVHVGQYQGWGEEGKGGWGYAAKSVWEQVTQGDKAYSIGTLDPNKPFGDYGIEQQAVIVEGYFNILSGASYGRGYTASPEQKAAMEAILRKKGLYTGILPAGGTE